MNSKIAITKCPSYESALVQDSVRRAIDLLGGISNFIKPGSRVLVKPNLLMGVAPEAGVCTHPEVIRAVIRILKEINCKISLGDSPSVWGIHIENVDNVYELSGVKKICLEEGVDLIKLEKRRWHGKFILTTAIDNCDYIVSIPKFKTHGLTTLTGAVKNLFGLVSGTYKTEVHKKYFIVDDFAGILVDIYEKVKPALTIIDAITAMEGDGPGTSGSLRQLNLILASSDGVALDAAMARIMGVNPLDVLTNKIAYKRGLGELDFNKIEVKGEKLEDVIGKPFLLPTSSMATKLPKPVINLIKLLIKLRPYVLYEKCIRCEACVKACPSKIIRLNNNWIAFDYSGCIACFCCQEVCPKAAIKVKKSLLARIIGL
ncbi:MAG: DUF362 domain-containing protein [Candidatus Omnitrophota bacterium]